MPEYIAQQLLLGDGSYLTMPAADGSANQVLSTDGSGSLGYSTALVQSGVTNRVDLSQTADDAGLRIIGFDDQNDHELDFYLDSGGYANLDADQGFLFKHGGVNVAFINSNGVNGFRMYDDIPLSFGATAATRFSLERHNSSGDLRLAYNTNSELLTSWSATAAAVNYLNISNAATGNPPTIAAVGSDTDIGLRLESKGAEDITLYYGSGNGVIIDHDGSSPSTRLLFHNSAGGGLQGELTFEAGGYYLQFIDGAVNEWFRISPSQATLSGDVLVSADPNNSPQAPLHVVGPDGDGTTPTLDANTVALFENSASASDAAYLSIVSGASGEAGILLGDTTNQDQAKLYIDSGGNLSLTPVGNLYLNSFGGSQVIYLGAGVQDDVVINGAGGKCDLVTGAVMGPLATGGNPVANTDGLMWYDTTLDRLQVYSNGSLKRINTMTPILIRPQQLLPASTDGFSVATRGVDNNHVVAAFDDSTDKTGYYVGFLPDDYQGDGLTVEIYWVADTATSGAGAWEVAFEQIENNGHDIDTDSFAAANSGSNSTRSTAGVVRVTSITFTDGADMDSLAAGDMFRMSINRNTGIDTVTGDLHVLGIKIRGTNDA